MGSKDPYVVMGLDKYAKLREYELAIAMQEAKADVEAGRCTTESIAEHMQRLTQCIGLSTRTAMFGEPKSF